MGDCCEDELPLVLGSGREVHHHDRLAHGPYPPAIADQPMMRECTGSGSGGHPRSQRDMQCADRPFCWMPTATTFSTKFPSIPLSAAPEFYDSAPRNAVTSACNALQCCTRLACEETNCFSGVSIS